MHKSRLAALMIDSQVDDLGVAKDFWSKALGYEAMPDDPKWAGKYSMLKTPDSQPVVEVQKVEHESRVHLDIETDDIEAEVARLTELGAKVIERFPRWVVMQAPTGHNFCVVNPQRADFQTSNDVNVWG